MTATAAAAIEVEEDEENDKSVAADVSGSVCCPAGHGTLLNQSMSMLSQGGAGATKGHICLNNLKNSKLNKKRFPKDFFDKQI